MRVAFYPCLRSVHNRSLSNSTLHAEFSRGRTLSTFYLHRSLLSLSPLRLLWKQQRSARARRVSRSLISRVVPLGSCTQVSRDSSVAGDLIVSLSLESGEPVNTRSSSSPPFSPPGRYCSLSFCLGVRGNPASAREYKPLSAVFCSTPEKL